MRGVFQSLLALAVVVRGRIPECQAMFAAMSHRQLKEHNSTTPFVSKGDTDILGALHTPTVSYATFEGEGNLITYGKVMIGVGNTGTGPDGCPNGCVHPLTASNDPDTVHFITTIILVDEHGAVVVYGELTPEDNNGQVATLDFQIVSPKAITPYAFCNVHGLWQGETVLFPWNNGTNIFGSCTRNKCMNERNAVTVGSAIAALKHRQFVTYGTKKAFPVKSGDVLNSLHRPVLTRGKILDGLLWQEVMFVTIGMGLKGPAGCLAVNACHHPVIASADPAVVHWPEYVYVVNEAGVVVFFEEYVELAIQDFVRLSFAPPANSSVLTAYHYCNIHGLFEGEPFTVEKPGTMHPYATCGDPIGL